MGSRTARSGKAEGLPYSLSRWTDLPAAKWPWFEAQLRQGWMVAFDPKTAVPSKWSLAPEDVLGLIFWTRRPQNLIQHAELLKPYPLVVHMTATGWHEVEVGAPGINEAIGAMYRLIGAFGVDHVEWRFSPVPAVPDVVMRFEILAASFAKMGLRRVYVSFLQDNDLMTEKRGDEERRAILREMAERSHGLDVIVCQDDRGLGFGLPRPLNLKYGVCESGRRFTQGPIGLTFDDCGCAQTADPFNLNEACTMGCTYCYAADKRLAPDKRDTTKDLPVMR
jgi:hypothetical protein